MSPAKTSNLETECRLCEPVSAGLYRPKELHQANYDRAEGHKYRYEWRGSCINGSVDGFGTLTVYADEVDFFELLANQKSGVRFRSGAPVVAVSADTVDVRLSSGAALAAPGMCPNSRRLMIWVIVGGPLQTHSSSVAKQVLRLARQRALESCPSLEGARYELHIVERQAVDRPGSSKESKVFTNPLERLNSQRGTSPRENEATSGLQKFITEWLGGTRYGDYVSCKGSKLSPDFNCDRGNHNSFVRTHARAMHQRHSARVRAEKERQQRVAAESQRRAATMVAAEAQQRLDAEVSLLTQRAERLLAVGAGTPAELATALEIDERRTLERLERGLQLDIEPVEGIRTIQHGGQNYYGVTYRATSLIADAEKRHRNQQMKERFSWSGWFDQTSSVGSERKLELTCLFRRAADVPKDRRSVVTKLVSLNSVGKAISIALECTTGTPSGDSRSREKQQGSEQAVQSELEEQIAALTTEQVLENPRLTEYTLASARFLFDDHCAACHGGDGQGKPGFPVLADDDWLYGGTLAKITESIRLGRKGAMPSHKDKLSEAEVDQLAKIVVELGEGKATDEGWALFSAKRCAACHGPKADGVLAELPTGDIVTVGAANLTDGIWRFGPGGYESAKQTIMYGVNQPGIQLTRNAACPGFTTGTTGTGTLLSPENIKKLVVYVHQLGDIQQPVDAKVANTTQTIDQIETGW